jgi:hypothetical protein
MRLAAPKNGVLLLSILFLVVSTLAADSKRIFPSEEHVYEVIPSSWITADGSPPHQQLYRRDADAFIFPSLRGTDEAESVPDFETGGPFFTGESKFPQKAKFTARMKYEPKVEIDVARNPQNGATMRISGLTQLRNLTFDEVKDIQKQFRHWLLDQSGFCFLCDRADRFVNLDNQLLRFWTGTALVNATFEKFADQYLNQPKELDIEYEIPVTALTPVPAPTTTPAPEKLAMKAIPVQQREELSITWGATAVYPFPPNTLSWVSRMTVGGRTDLQIVRTKDLGLALLPRGTRKLSSQDEKFVDTGAVMTPFPKGWSGLFGTLFVPIYGPLDLQNDRLLEYVGGEDNKNPTCLLLLSPLQYLRAEPSSAKGSEDNQIHQFSADARRAPGTDQTSLGVEQLARQFILIGLEKCDKDSGNSEFSRLLKAALLGAVPAGNKGWVMGVFANQTLVEVRRHIKVNDRYIEQSRSRLDTWGNVVGSYLLPLLMDKKEDIFPQPILEVTRTNVGIARDESSTPVDPARPVERLKFRFYSTEERLLDAAQIAEGDEFNVGSRFYKKVL